MNDWVSTSALYGPHLAHHGIKDQKWGIRNGPPYPLDRSSDAEKIYANAKSHVLKIASDVKDCAKRSGSKMYGLEHRLKTVQSIDRKLSKAMNEEKLTKEEAVKSIKDAVRFTTISSEDSFVNSYFLFKKFMEDKGYVETRCKNYYDLFNKGKVKHKAVQSNFQSSDGYTFEVQFHTVASQDVKNRKVKLYEEARKENVDPNRKKQIEKEMERMAMSISDPKNIYNIKSH